MCRQQGPLRPQPGACSSKHAGESTSTNTQIQRQLEWDGNWNWKRGKVVVNKTEDDVQRERIPKHVTSRYHEVNAWNQWTELEWIVRKITYRFVIGNTSAIDTPQHEKSINESMDRNIPPIPKRRQTKGIQLDMHDARDTRKVIVQTMCKNSGNRLICQWN